MENARIFGPVLVLLIVGVFGFAYLHGRLSDLENATPVVQDPGVRMDFACVGTLDSESVQRSVGEHGPGVFACHEEHDADAEGVLALELSVDEEGRVTAMRAGGSLGWHRELVTCARDDLARWRFDPPEGGCAIVSVPFALGGPEQEDGPDSQ